MRTVDFVGTTHAIRFGRADTVLLSTPLRLCTLTTLDADMSTALPAMRALMDLGVVFTVVYRGCPMLRAEHVPTGVVADQHIASLASEFASAAMRFVVRENVLGDAIENNGDGDEVSCVERDDCDDGADDALVEEVSCNDLGDSDKNDDDDDASENASDVSAVSNVVDVVSKRDECLVAAAREWDDAPLCALIEEHAGASAEHIGARQRWKSTTSVAVECRPISEAECSFECGKRLNRTVMAMLQHAGLGGDCVSLFSEPEKLSVVSKLRRFTKQYRTLFSTAARNWFESARVAGCFRALSRGVFVFGRSAEIVQHAVRVVVVERVVPQQLAPSIAWRVECERARASPLSDSDVSVVVSSLDALRTVCARSDGSRLRAIALSFGAAAVEVDVAELDRLLRSVARHLRVLTLLGCKAAPVERFCGLLGDFGELVFGWHVAAAALAAKRELARKFPLRVCLLSTLDGDAAQAKNDLLAMGFDEAIARTLVGTHMATLPLRVSATRQIASVSKVNERV